MADPSTSQTPVAFVENALALLLSAPHISIPRGSAGIRLGPGPIDLFSTRFTNTFTTGATGVVDGEQVDREGLKEKLLALQRHYSPNTVKFQGQQPSTSDQTGSDDVRVSFTWTKDQAEHEVSTSAVVVNDGGASKISSLALYGKQELFVKPAVV